MICWSRRPFGRASIFNLLHMKISWLWLLLWLNNKNFQLYELYFDACLVYYRGFDWGAVTLKFGDPDTESEKYYCPMVVGWEQKINIPFVRSIHLIKTIKIVCGRSQGFIYSAFFSGRFSVHNATALVRAVDGCFKLR
jgi:hypothetical protein